MSYQEFLNEVLKRVKELYPEYEVFMKPVTKNNGIVLDGLLIDKRDEKVTPIIYLNSYYEMLTRETPFNIIIDMIIESYEEGISLQDFDVSFLLNFDTVKDRIIYKLINAEANKELLKDIPYIPFWGLAICFLCMIDSNELREGTLLIHNELCEMWNVNTKMMLDLAEVNTPKLLPAVQCDVQDVIGNLLDSKEIEQESELRIRGMLYVLTNQTKILGASVMLYPDTLSNIANSLKGDFFVLPSSIHELLIQPVNPCVDIDIQMDNVKKYVSIVNDTEVIPEEILTNNPFYYSFKDKLLKQL